MSKASVLISGREGALKLLRSRLAVPLMALVALVGYIFGIEIFTNLALVLFVAAGLLLADTAEPLAFFGVSFLLQISRAHSPGYAGYLQGFSDYLFTSYRLPLLIIEAALLFGAMGVYLIQKRLWRAITPTTCPMAIPLALLWVALTLNGAFSQGWSLENATYGFLQGLFFFGVFCFFYAVVLRDGASLWAKRLVYISSVLVILLFVELLYVFLTGGVLHDGIIDKELVIFGWGIWNTAGCMFVMLLPVCFLGFLRYSPSPYYLLTSALALIGAVGSMSRNAQLFALATAVALAVLACFFAKGRTTRLVFRILTALGALLVLLVAVLFWDKLSGLLSSFFGDNGRYELWGKGIDNFLESPVFGKGFYSFSHTEFVTTQFLPDMPHNTVVTLLSATGVFGIVCYLVYRVFSILPFLRRPSVERALLLCPVLLMALCSLLDNFIFYFLPVIYYSLSMAVGQGLCLEDSLEGKINFSKPNEEKI